MKNNRITCRVEKGYYKDELLEIEMGPDHTKWTIWHEKNGQKVQLLDVQAIYIKCILGSIPRVTIERVIVP